MSSAAEFPIIGIGASAGGIDAFHGFFSHVPPDCGMAFVMILHLPAERKSLLTEILSRWTSMPVIEVAVGVLIQPKHVYVPPPHAVVTLNAVDIIAPVEEIPAHLMRLKNAALDLPGAIEAAPSLDALRLPAFSPSGRSEVLNCIFAGNARNSRCAAISRKVRPICNRAHRATVKIP
jgi:hypothetical protein